MGAFKLVAVLFVMTAAVDGTTTTTTTTTTEVFVPGNLDCVTNPAEWTVVMTDVNEQLPNFDSIVQCAVAQMLDTACSCVDLEGPITRRLFASRGRRLNTVGRKGMAGVFPNATATIISESCSIDNQTALLTTLICNQAGNGNNCSARAQCSQFTTTTEMPWGMPWWAWFLVCCGICALLGLCCLPLLGVPMMGGKKKTKPAPSQEVVYEVVDVPDETVPMASAAY